MNQSEYALVGGGAMLLAASVAMARILVAVVSSIGPSSDEAAERSAALASAACVAVFAAVAYWGWKAGFLKTFAGMAAVAVLLPYAYVYARSRSG